MTLRTVGVRLTAEIGEFQSKLKAASQSTRDFKGQLDKAAQKGNLDKVADRAAKVGLALGGMAGYAIKTAADFDKSMSAVAAANYDSSKSIKENARSVELLRVAALKAGKDTQYSAGEAADGITELSKAGVSTADILGGGLKGALALAAAGQLSVGDAAETAASAMTQFRLSGKDVPHIADLLAAGAGKAQGSVKDMGMALSQSGLVAAQFGLSIEDTTGVLAEFASAGLTGSDAGTSLKTMLLALANPTQQTRTEMDHLGISFYDAQGEFIGLGGVAQVLQTRLKGLTDAQRQQALGQIFGNDAIRSASILYTDGAKGVDDWKTKVNDAGYAMRNAAKLVNNLAGDLERLKGSFDTLAIEAGSGPSSGLRVLTKGLNGVVDAIGSLPSGVTAGVTVLAGLGGAALLVGSGWLKLRKSTTAVLEELRKVGPMGEKVATGLQTTSKWAGRAALAFAGVQAAGAALSAAFGTNLNPQVDALGQSLEQWAASGQKGGEAARLLGANFKHLGYDLGSLGSGFWAKAGNGLEGLFEGWTKTGDLWDETLQHSKERLGAIDQALAGMVQNGQSQEAAQIFQHLAGEAKKAGISVADLKSGLPAYEGAVETAGSATKGAAGKLGSLNSALDVGAAAQDKYRTHAEAVAGAARGERAALGALFAEMQAQTDPVFALIEAQRKLADAQDAAAKAVKGHGAKSKEAKATDIDLAKAAIDLQGATGNLTASFNGKLTPAMRATLQAAGLTKGQIAAVEGQFTTAKKSADKFAGKYAADVSAPGAKQAKKEIDVAYTSANGFAGPYAADISAPGAKQAKKDIDKAYTSANGFAGPYVADVKLSNVGPVENKLNELRNKQLELAAGPTASAAQTATENYYKQYHKKATGGPIFGPGTSTSDSIPALLSDGEYVIKASSVQQVGMANLDVINNEGRLPQMYSAGGPVWPFPATVSKTKIPSLSDVLNAVLPAGGGPGPGGGETYKWILKVVAAAFPALHATSTFRPGAVTLSGNRSYHAVGRAVDYPPSKALAEWVNAHYFAATRELITPWNSLNIHNGRRHTYTGDIYAQHAGLGRFKGNAHDHWAMARGGVIPEHVVGVGLGTGRTYEFGEHGPETVLPGYARGGLVNVQPRTSTTGSRLDTADAMLSAANAVSALTAALQANGRSWSVATQKGRDNRSSLISGVKAAQDAAKAKYEETGSVKAANKVYDDYIHQLDESMKKMHVNTATRRSLIKAYSERPKYDTSSSSSLPNSSDLIKATQDHVSIEDSLQTVRGAFAWTKPSFDVHTESGRSELTTLFGFLNAAASGAQSMYDYMGDAKQATAYYQGYLSQLKAVLIKSGMSAKDADALLKRYGRITLTPKANRWGGLYEHAAGGALRDAQIAAGGPTQYAWAEPSTGGELFAPKNGDLQKTRSQVGWAVANWWGGQVNWGGQSGGKNVTVQATIPITLGAETITRQVELVVDTALGQVASATVYQTA